MADPDPDLEVFERQMRARRRTIEVLSAIAVIALMVWRGSALLDRCNHGENAPSPPGIEVDVDAAGRIAVRGCAGDPRACIEVARKSENSRPGGGRLRALVHVASGAPQSAIRDARAVLLANDFTPEND